RSLAAAALLLCALATTAFDRGEAQEKTPRPPDRPARVLPGVQANGVIQLPDQWSLRPAGKQVELGDFPVNLALHPGGQWLAALHAGHGAHEIIVVNLKTQKVVSRVELDQTFYGVCFSPDGGKLYASGGEFEVVHAFDFEDGLLSKHRQLAVVPAKEKFIPGGVAIDSAGKTLFVAGPWGDAVCILPVDDAEKRVIVPFEKDSYPYTCLSSKDGR